MNGPVYVGAISGTSVDGLDFALLEIGDAPRVLAAHTQSFPSDLRRLLLALGQPGHDDLDRLGAADVELGRFIGEAVLAFVERVGYAPCDITAIGSHGQTVRHRPGGPHPFTLQIGDPNSIAELTGITTVADFRRRDVAAGGQGAPLVPPFHAALFRTEQESRAVLNLGGIANLTLLPAGSDAPVTGFDTGPSNALMDAWVLRCRKLEFDAGGAWAASGHVDAALLERLLKDPYFSAAPPKSTGREYFNLDWLAAHLHDAGAGAGAETRGDRAADIQATLCALTADSVARALTNWGADTERVLVCGGGRHNRALMMALERRLACPIAATDEYGIDGDTVEAAAFAWLAHRTLNGLSGNEPGVTGARGVRVLGAVYCGSEWRRGG